MAVAEGWSVSKMQTRAWIAQSSEFATPEKIQTLLQSEVECVDLTCEYVLHPGQNQIEKGQKVSFTHTGKFRCVNCQKNVSKLVNSFCFSCYRSKACADLCLLNPHNCHFLKGTCREPEWGLSFCYQPHFLYLAYTDKYKIGITRQGQIPTRWIDQGATAATVLAQVCSRHQAGVLEKFLTEILADKSNWQRMLKEGNERPDFSDFSSKRAEVLRYLTTHPVFTSGSLLTPNPEQFTGDKNLQIYEKSPVFHITFPFPSQKIEKIVSNNLDKTSIITGIVKGIKGQYIFLDDYVFNVRRHEGYVIDLSIEKS